MFTNFVLKSCSLSSICAFIHAVMCNYPSSHVHLSPGPCSAFTLESNIFTFIAFLVKKSISAILGYRCPLLAVSCRLLIWHRSISALQKRQKVEPILYMTEWFMCIYSRTLPWSSVLRMWDMFLCEGTSRPLLNFS